MGDKERTDDSPLIAALRKSGSHLPNLPEEVLACLACGDECGAFLAWADGGAITRDGWLVLLSYLSAPSFNQDLRHYLRGGREDA